MSKYGRYATAFTLFCALWFMAGCGEDPKSKSVTTQEAPIQVKVHTLKKRAYPLWIRFTGKTEAVEAVDVITRVRGELKAYHFTPGQQVRTGTLLFSIDKSEYRAAWEKTFAALEKDKAAYALAKANVRRYTPLVKEQLAPREKLDQLTATLKELEAAINADKAALERAKIDLDYCDIKASIDGRIGKPFILPGNTVNPGDKLSRIVRSDRLYVNFNPSAREVALIKRYAKDDHPKVRVGIKGDTAQTAVLHGRVDFIDNASNAMTGTVSMRAIVENPEGMIFPGSFVEVELFLGDYNVLAVHPDQISLDQQGEYVYTVDANNTLHRTYIRPIFGNNDLVLVGKSLKEGDRVVAEMLNNLAEGLKVAPVEVPDPIHIEE